MQTYPAWPSLPAMMLGRAAEWPDRPMLRRFAAGKWQTIAWSAFARETGAVAGWWAQSGLNTGDRVVMVAENRPEYVIAETALMSLRLVPVPTYVSNTVEDHAHIVAQIPVPVRPSCPRQPWRRNCARPECRGRSS